MKKIFILGLSIALLTTAASAQRGPGDRSGDRRISQSFHQGEINRGERFRLRKDEMRLHRTERNIHRDGIVSPMERRRVQKMRHHNRHEIYRFRHNRRHRII